jgi:hypothetical protein
MTVRACVFSAAVALTNGIGMSLIDQFHSDPDVFVFLISTMVGGTGLNLQGANRVVIFGASMVSPLEL